MEEPLKTKTTTMTTTTKNGSVLPTWAYNREAIQD